MRGENLLTFNEATMELIVQYYLDEVLLRDELNETIVKSIAYKAGDGTYEVRVATTPREPAED